MWLKQMALARLMGLKAGYAPITPASAATSSFQPTKPKEEGTSTIKGSPFLAATTEPGLPAMQESKGL